MEVQEAGKKARLLGPDHPAPAPAAATATASVEQQHGEQQDAEMGDASPSGAEHGQQGELGAKAKGKKEDKEWYSDENTVFIKGLPYGVKESDLEDFFKSCGGLRKVRLPKDPAGKPRVSAAVFHAQSASRALLP